MSDVADPAYRVLARAYRPGTLKDLIGQEALVRSLTHAFQSGRLAQAYLLTGIRGTGKTTTARIIARCLNCTGPDGQGGVTPDPCGVCPNCVAIAEDRHIDVIEMDAATRTGIDDIREIVDAIRYAPATGRYKIFIIDEVHMLSEKAFNGLLKTLEEPPPHGKFVFATTEVRKLPVTVLSRCQRFDLRRIDADVLAQHLRKIATSENASVDDEALQLLVGAAGGSARDALSLLDQAITLSDGAVDATTVKEMLGLADRSQVQALMAHVVGGDAKGALDLYQELINQGADPLTLLEDLLNLCHRLTRVSLVDGAIAEPELQAMAQRLGQAGIGRAWQVLLQGLGEVSRAPDAIIAAEMLLVRLATMGSLPSPEDLARAVDRLRGDHAPSGQRSERMPATPSPPTLGGDGRAAVIRPAAPAIPIPAQLEPSATMEGATALPTMPTDLRSMAVMLASHGEPILAASLRNSVRLVAFEPGRLILSWSEGSAADLTARLREALHRITGRSWAIELGASSALTLAEEADAHRAARLAAVAELPHVRHILDQVPGSEIVDVEDDLPSAADPSQGTGVS